MNRPGDRYWHSNQGARCKVLDWLTRRNDKDEHAYTPKQIADAIGASHDAIRQLLPRRVAAGEIRRSWSGAYTCRRSGEDDRYRVEHTIRQCLENLERESLDPPMLAKAALEQTIQFMGRTCGVDFTRSQVRKLSDELIHVSGRLVGWRSMVENR